MRPSTSLALAATLLVSLACGSKTNPGTDGSTHFWVTCTTDSECDGANECICGHCTTECTSDAQCTRAASRCEVASSRLDCAVDDQICVPDEPPSVNGSDASVMSIDASVETPDASIENVSSSANTSTANTDASIENSDESTEPHSDPTSNFVNVEPTTSSTNATLSDGGPAHCLDTPGCPWTSLPAAPFTQSLTAVHDSKFYAIAGNYPVTNFDAGPRSSDGPSIEWRNGNFVYDVTTQQWSTLAAGPDDLWAANAEVIGDNAYLPNRDGRMFIYDIVNDTWSNGTEVPDSLTAASSQAVGNLLYLFGGYHAGPDGESSGGNPNSNLGTYVYTPESDTWHTVADAPSPPGSTSCTWNGGLFAFSGPNNDDPSLSGIMLVNDTETTVRWGLNPSRRPNVDYQQYCVVLGDDLYIFGGTDSDASGSDVITRYRPATDTWEEVSFPPGLISSQPQVVDDAIYVVGYYRDSEATEGQFWRFAPSP